MSNERLSSDLSFSIASKEWANDQLRFAIGILQGKICTSTWKGRLQIALIVKQGLEEKGFWWQAERIENYIHRLQRAGRVRADSQRKEEREASL